MRAQQLSCLILLLLLAPWVLRTDRNHLLRSTSEAVRIGLLWTAATVIFESASGRYSNGESWQTLLAAYNLAEGRLWALDIAGIAAAPSAAG